MERAVKVRAAARAALTRSVNRIKEELTVETPNRDAIQVTLAILEKKAAELNELDAKILELLLDNDADIEQESIAAEEYQRTFLETRQQVVKLLNFDDENISNSSSNGNNSENVVRKFRLPELELRKFNGDIKEWLAFWSQFEKIDKDSEIPPEDKFQYLIQATEKKSRAREVVDSFPPTGANYTKAVQALKARFGREELLVEVYVRELLKQVLNNALHPKVRASSFALYDKLESHLRALETLGVTTEKCTAMLYPLVESCLPEDILRAWQRSTASSEGTESNKRLERLMDFLRTEVENEERINLAMTGFGLKDEKTKTRKNLDATAGVSEVPTIAGLLTTDRQRNFNDCGFCEGKHYSADCITAQNLRFEEKTRLLKERGCCFLCLRPGHVSRKCKARVKCPLCGQRHVILMCQKLDKNRQESVTKADRNSLREPTTPSEHNLTATEVRSGVFLQTLVVTIRSDNMEQKARVIIDTGSQRSYITEALAVQMGYFPSREETVIHSLFGGLTTEEHRHKCYRIRIGSLNDTYRCSFEALGQRHICGEIPKIKGGPWTKELQNKNIQLSDLQEGNSSIDLLIGADVAGKLLTGRREVLKCGVVAIETFLGWTLMGKNTAHTVPEGSVAMLTTSLFVQEAAIKDLWTLDMIGIQDPVEQKSKAEREFVTRRRFLETLTINEQGHYEVQLPWREDRPLPPANRRMAERRLELLVKQLEKTGLTRPYDEILCNWLQDGIIEEVPLSKHEDRGHYLPHRPLVKETSATTPIRPIFDASAAEKGQPSLNHCLEKGPNLLEKIPDLLLRFRTGKIAVIADIKRAFLQIGIRPKDRDFLRFLWIDLQHEGRLKIYRHARVVFGVTCSPFLLAGVLEHVLQAAKKESGNDHALLTRLENSFYVDNVVTSVDSESELQQFMEQAKAIMSNSGFDLRAWEYSREEVTEDYTFSSVLGLKWDKRHDELLVNLDWWKPCEDTKITRRVILSATHRVFDPIGVFSPVLLLPKLLLQRLWKMGGDWDREIDLSIASEFLQWYADLGALREIRLPRWIWTDPSEAGDRELHVFCDASKVAYAAVVYLRAATAKEIKVSLVTGRARVAPLKTITIPRLELLAATIGARLADNVKNTLGWVDMRVHMWSDSMTVLSWITREDNWSVFVTNRVKEIRQLTEMAAWHHVSGDKNPADLPSRGCNAKQLLVSGWWNGPEWLMQPREDWPKSRTHYDETEIATERRRSTNRSLNETKAASPVIQGEDSHSLCLSVQATPSTLVPADNHHGFFRYFSDFDHLVRMMGWVLRFLNNIRGRRCSGELAAKELEAAEEVILRLVQAEAFQDAQDKRLAPLNVIKDSRGLLRLKTRLTYCNDSEDFRRPVVLPPRHPVVDRLILTRHKKLCHPGVQMTLGILRENYWILRARRTIRAVLKTCGLCRRYECRRLEAPVAPLPVDRVREATVFEVLGIDLAGPLFLKGGAKTWICLFTCAIYRAVHLELVTSLSTEVFLQALRRFVARRGRPAIIYSDNGTNFTGAARLLRSVDFDAVQQFAATQRIEWKFNPPTAAWWGGWWERLIRILKNLLRRTLGRACLTYEELTTVLQECESVINSRPLTYVSERDSDLLPLTPSMFLRGAKGSGLPECDQLDAASANRRVRYQMKLIQDLRQRFRTEYLGQLVQRGKEKGVPAISVGDVVLIERDDSRRMHWPMGRVIELLPDRTGVVRLVRLQTTSGQVLRPIQRIYPLELTSGQPECRTLLQQKQTVTRSGRVVKPPPRPDL